MLKTQCPKCHSYFNLTRAHLEAAGGKVRCGHCMAVFRVGDTGYAKVDAHALSIMSVVSRDIFVWLPISILLFLLLVGQYMWVNFDLLAGKSSWRGAYQMVCYLFDCQLPEKKDSSSYAIRPEELRVFPTNEQAETRRLYVRLTNHSYVEQALPDILITFRDVNYHVLASGYYTAAQYLPYKQRALQPDKSVDVNLTFVNPGADAVNYDLEILE